MLLCMDLRLICLQLQLQCQVDFGCGSGSLLDGLLLCPTSLEKIVGVDISVKGLARAAKVSRTEDAYFWIMT